MVAVAETGALYVEDREFPPGLGNVADILRLGREYLGGSTARVDDSGQYNTVFIVDDAEVPYVIKRPIISPLGSQTVYDAHASLHHERRILNLVGQTPEPSPITVPMVLLDEPVIAIAPSANYLRYIPGSTLSLGDIRNLPENMQIRLGRDIADFVHWMSTIDTATYQAKIASITILPHHNREEVLYGHRFWQTSELLRDMGQHTLAGALDNLLCQYQRLRHSPRRRVVGHEDLGPSNLVFDRATGTLNGVIDFGNVQLSTPEREFRYLALIGRAATEAALGRYEEISNFCPSPESVSFWARAQVTLVAVYCRMHNVQMDYTELAHRLEYVWPDEDWQEIQGA